MGHSVEKVVWHRDGVSRMHTSCQHIPMRPPATSMLEYVKPLPQRFVDRPCSELRKVAADLERLVEHPRRLVLVRSRLLSNEQLKISLDELEPKDPTPLTDVTGKCHSGRVTTIVHVS
ncbi:hypothetical protein PsorP6_011013 [Peronosclerospora sorghi]|uniref:Uncharacterized protein n=1 Tax=Peronosclerospora sorghi TaxID=230839 RepID=A0ACC0VX79_9STRA|nr:hypothetical protein PsorP6_011013 [Peronosclerospora sorghi]